MATASKIYLTPDESGEYHLQPITDDAARKSSELLQENHDRHNIFFNLIGFHNHIAHHLLTLHSLGASVSQIQRQYDGNKHYQMAPKALNKTVIEDLSKPTKFMSFLGKGKYYVDYLHFFQKEIQAKGWESVVNDYIFSGDERGDALFSRLFAGVLHPLIHLGFGVEFRQPAIIAEALALAAVDRDTLSPLFFEAEKQASKFPERATKTFVQLIDQIQATESLRSATEEDSTRLFAGVEKEAKTMIDILAQYRIPSADLISERTAEMTNTTAYFTGAAQRPPKAVKIDFYYMHSLNASIFFPAFMRQRWLSEKNKIRLLEWKIRNDAVIYASRGCAKLLLDEIKEYQPKKQSSGWEDIIERVNNLPGDDGHAAKLIRALAHGEQISKPYETKENFRIKGDMWLKLGHMSIDSVESAAPMFVRAAGLTSSWEEVEDRHTSHL